MRTGTKKNTAGMRQAVKKKRIVKKIGDELSRNKVLYVMTIPVLLYFILFCYLPMFGLVIAFKDYSIAKGIFASEWVGLKHFEDFFSGVYFARTLRNTLLISIYQLIFSFPAPIIFALLINEIKNNRFKKIVQTVTYLPHFISLVVICGIITNFFSTSGLITNIITLLGGERINYIGTAKYFRSIYIGTGIWQNLGWSSIIYLAALAGIDQELYESASIDGANKLKQVWHITLPGIMPTIVILLIMQIGQILNVGYEKIILLYSDATLKTADVISSFVYRRGLESGNQYSYAAAVGMFSSVVNLIILVFANQVSKKFGETSLF